jgi:antitoxin ParD1/3/4
VRVGTPRWYRGPNEVVFVNVSLHPRLAQFVEEQVQSGRFGSTDDVVNSAVARLQADSELSPHDVDLFRADVAAGLEQADRGELLPWDAEDVWAEVERHNCGAGVPPAIEE